MAKPAPAAVRHVATQAPKPAAKPAVPPAATAGKPDPMMRSALSIANQIIGAQLAPTAQTETQLRQQGSDQQNWLTNLQNSYQSQLDHALSSEPDSAKSTVGRLLDSAAAESTGATADTAARQRTLADVLGSDTMQGAGGNLQSAISQTNAAQRIGQFGLNGQSQLDWLKRSGLASAGTTAAAKTAAQVDNLRKLQELEAQRNTVRAQLPAVLQDALQRERQWSLDQHASKLADLQFGAGLSQQAVENDLRGRQIDAQATAAAKATAARTAAANAKNSPTAKAQKIYERYFSFAGRGPGVVDANGKWQGLTKPFRSIYGELRNYAGMKPDAAAWQAAKWMYGGSAPGKIKNPDGAYSIYLSLGVSKPVAQKIVRTYYSSSWKPFTESPGALAGAVGNVLDGFTKPLKPIVHRSSHADQEAGSAGRAIGMN